MAKINQWFVNGKGSVQHKMTSETSEFGLNGEIYDKVESGPNAGFTVLIRNVVIANRIIRQGLTRYDLTETLQSGEELVERLPIEMYTEFKHVVNIQDPDMQCVIANRS